MHSGYPAAVLVSKRRVLIEFACLVLGTLLYFFIVPRNTKIDMAFGLLGFLLVLASIKETRDKFWDSPLVPFQDRNKHAFYLTAMISIPVFALFALIGFGQNYYFAGRWEIALKDLFTFRLLISLPIYVLWALVQQFLLQFYLLSRLRVLFSGMPVFVLIGINGIFFSLVHIPDWDIVALTIVAGAVWSYIYLKDRCLLPLALSHAILGATYFNWVAQKTFFDSLFQ